MAPALGMRLSTLMKARSRILPTVAFVGVAVVAFVGCTNAPAPQGDGEDNEQAAQIVEVARRDITSALTLPVTVLAGAEFDITAPMDGVFESDGTDPTVNGQPLGTATLDGVRVLDRLVEDGTRVGRNLPILRAAVDRFVLRADVTPAQLPLLVNAPVRVRAQLEGGGAAFTCTLLDPVPTYDDAGASVYSCAIPSGVTAVEGMTGRMVIVLAEHEHVDALPIAAVSGTVDDGEVRLPDGTTRVVELGITDGQYIEVTSGLNEGDTVTLPSPSLLETE